MVVRRSTHAPMTRSEIMSRVHSKDTAPELLVRSALHRLGFRYRLHVPTLPGSPDLVFPSRRKVLFIHGCFWHGHNCKCGARTPKTNTDYWLNKIDRNRHRDTLSVSRLIDEGWAVMIVWECELSDLAATLNRIIQFLSQT